jgi:hypothetical protein
LLGMEWYSEMDGNILLRLCSHFLSAKPPLRTFSRRNRLGTVSFFRYAQIKHQRRVMSRKEF